MFFPSEQNQHHQQTFLSLLHVQYMTFCPIFIYLFFVCCFGYIPALSWRRAPVLPAWLWCLCCSTSSPEGPTNWRLPYHMEASWALWPSPWCPVPSASWSTTTSPTTPRLWKKWDSAGSNVCRGFTHQIPNLNGCKVRRRAPADSLPPFPPQVGLSILVISTVVMSILSGIAVKDVLWTIFMPDVLTVAALMPLIGFTLGYVMSYLCRLNPQWVETALVHHCCAHYLERVHANQILQGEPSDYPIHAGNSMSQPPTSQQ